MSKLTTAVIVCMIATTRADTPSSDNSIVITQPALGEKIVGESVPLHMEIYYSPANYCKVDPKAELIEQLNQCKNQRKGWLKI